MTAPKSATASDRPSLEALVERGMLKLESLHPGGLSLTRELADLCRIGPGAALLDVACGTGESACFVAATYRAHVEGIDTSEPMIRRAKAKAEARALDASFEVAAATDLPFADATFDAAICECTLCLLDIPRVLDEMVRVVRPGGRVGMHDLCWQPNAPAALQRALAEAESEFPETLEGWRRQFERTGLDDVTAIDRSGLMSQWMRESRRQLGLMGQVRLTLQIIRRWGPVGAWRVWQSERVLASEHLGYAIVVGTRRPAH